MSAHALRAAILTMAALTVFAAEARAQGSVALRAFQPEITVQQSAPTAPAPVALRQVVVASRALPARHIVRPEDVRLETLQVAAGLPHPELAIGLETATAVPAGQALQPELLGAPAVIDRNDRVLLQYRRGPLTIRVEGRALERAAVGKRLAAMNLTSRQTVTGTAVGPGLMEVSR
ncbi:MAG: flagellar basal body P-ring formation chaperone FlgA [Pseudomonadota bacterium]